MSFPSETGIGPYEGSNAVNAGGMSELYRQPGEPLVPPEDCDFLELKR